MATPTASIPTVLAWSLLAVPLVIAEATNTKSSCGQHLRYRKPLTESLEWQTYSVPLMIVLGAGCALAWCILFIIYDVSQRGKDELPQIPSAEEISSTLRDQEEENEAMFQVENKIIDENIGIPLPVESRPANEDNRSSAQLYPEPTSQNSWSLGQPYAEPTSLINGSMIQLYTEPTSQISGGLGQLNSQPTSQANGSMTQQFTEPTGQTNGSLAQLNIQTIKEDHVSLTQLASQSPSQENVVPPLQEESSSALHKSSQTEEENGGDSLWTFMEHELEKLLTALRLHRYSEPNPPAEETAAPPVEEMPAPPLEQPNLPAEEIPSPSRVEENQPTMHLIICEVPRNEGPVRGRGRKRRTSKGCK